MDCEARTPRYWPKSCREKHPGFGQGPPTSLSFPPNLTRNAARRLLRVPLCCEDTIDLKTSYFLWDSSPGPTAEKSASLTTVPSHKACPSKQFLDKEFGNQITGYGGVEDWPPRLHDLTPQDFFL
ncbi:hypothetical protein TNCV_3203801 [Trichonephila clavipes]|nr:hypothetical protein TNCV_3203801 [Trichonephila clavipes]